MSEFKMQVVDKLPERSNKRSTSLSEVLEFVKVAAGKWCLISEHKSTAAASSRAQVYRRTTSKIEYEFVARTVSNGKGKVGQLFGRYKGGQS